MATINSKSNRIKNNEKIRLKITDRLRKLRRSLSNNGDADLQVEYEVLHKLIGKKLPRDYEVHYNE